MRLQFATENLLAEYGGDIIVKHMELQRLSECIIDIYTAVAVIGRFLHKTKIIFANT